MKTKKILVVDDDPTVLHLLETHLSKTHGYDVLVAKELIGNGGLIVTARQMMGL